MKHMLRPGGVFAAVAVALAVGIAGPADAATSDEAAFLSLTNQLRASRGLPALTIDGQLSSVARAWAGVMAAKGTISHNPSLGVQLPGDWLKSGENVGMGPDVETIHNALVNSPSHYANLVDAEFQLMGVGVVRSGNTVFVVENFLTVRSGAGGGGGGGGGAYVEPEPVYEEPVYEEPVYEVPVAQVPPPRHTANGASVASAPVPAPAPAAPAMESAPEALETDPDASAPGRLALGLELLRALDGQS